MKIIKTITQNCIIIALFVFLPFVLFGQAKTVNYNIPEWGKSGSFTFSAGSAANAKTGENEGTIQIKDSNDNLILEITPNLINAIKSKLKSNNIPNKNIKSKMYNMKSTNTNIKQLEQLYAKLTNTDELNKLLKLFSNSQQKASGLNWSHFLTTIRNQQIQVTGTIQ